MAIFNSYVKLPEGNILVITVVITNIVHKLLVLIVGSNIAMGNPLQMEVFMRKKNI